MDTLNVQGKDFPPFSYTNVFITYDELELLSEIQDWFIRPSMGFVKVVMREVTESITPVLEGEDTPFAGLDTFKKFSMLCNYLGWDAKIEYNYGGDVFKIVDKQGTKKDQTFEALTVFRIRDSEAFQSLRSDYLF